jgi:uncharacterized protein YutE (UPF0331/DUF86 family)
MEGLEFLKEPSLIISVNEARKILGVKYKDVDDDVIEQIIKELESLADIALDEVLATT